MNRPHWQEHWMRMATLASEMSTCASGRKVGAVAVSNNRLLATGFNGVPSGSPHPEICLRRQQGVPSGTNYPLCGCQHAEANVVATSARHGVSLFSATIVCTTRPCSTCMGILANAGIERVIYRDEFNDPNSSAIAQHANIAVVKLCR